MRINNNIQLILKTYLIVIFIFSAFRCILFFTELDRIDFDEVSTWTIIQSFIMGIRFDIVISSYILFIPALILLIEEIVNLRNRIIYKIIFYWIFILFSFSFLIAAADIPYFNQFFERFSIGAFEWINNFDFVVSMIIQEPKYFLIAIPFIFIELIFFVLLKRIFKLKEHKPVKINLYINIFLSLLVLSIMFVGIRGRIQKKSPIRIGTAYFSDNAFLNKLGLNPVFTLIRSGLDDLDVRNEQIDLIDKQIAIKNIRRYHNINSKEYASPIARKIVPDSSSEIKPNVVLIIMEGMSAHKMGRHGNKNNLTPFLDSLSNKSIYFENFYTSGKHTFNGIFSSLYSFPALYRKHPMNRVTEYNGMSSTLLNNGYSTTYFTTHDSQFDNVEGFLRANGFQNIISQLDYPSNEVKTALGVSDDFMFRFSIPKINELYEKDKPFLAVYMTASDHGPYYVPDYFQPKSKDIKNMIVEYADWSLKTFIELCSEEEWFDNTIFLFVADHGSPLSSTYEIPLSYFHTPFIIYAPKIITSNIVYDDMGSQIDIFPTLMGIIKQPYVNNTLGIDLLREKRKYVIINNDSKIGILDTSYFCIVGKENINLYKYKNQDKTDYFSQEVDKAKEMKEYGQSLMQTYQDMLNGGEINIENKD
ncbi:MAG: sulfatase-like hydrolase/transferase [Lentimicrobiaceae bacterium]|jgi:phosphoglycerol transferase MdoB-like AlkP superfamily enzyme|nr:sulfatase-like hydrolase/transferase [Lentimicrobiaceae bacterium]MBT6672953.1 sulfatase-like hydrolase/transferase [Lentimicrobiaceae bacterium]MBT7621347.1 sulfatase-like hydrolase/transferase [Lentimicrobiaceae bacterium]